MSCPTLSDNSLRQTGNITDDVWLSLSLSFFSYLVGKLLRLLVRISRSPSVSVSLSLSSLWSLSSLRRESRTICEETTDCPPPLLLLLLLVVIVLPGPSVPGATATAILDQKIAVTTKDWRQKRRLINNSFVLWNGLQSPHHTWRNWLVSHPPLTSHVSWSYLSHFV